MIEQVGRSQQGLVTTAELRRAGVSRSRLSRAVAQGSVVRVRRHVYGLAPLDPLPRFVVTDDGVSARFVAHVRADLLSLGPSATACTRTAAALYGWGMLVEPARTVDVMVKHGRSRVNERRVHVVQRRSAARQQVTALPETSGLWATTPVQTVVDCALSLPLLEAVVICDSALRVGSVTVEELLRAAARLRGVRDARQVRQVIDLCDPGSGSVLESVLRVRMLLAGIEGFDPQRVIRDLPGLHLRVDFCFAASGVVVEVDGARWHQDVARDQARDNALAGLGWRVLRYTWAQVVNEPTHVLAEIRAAVACATPSFQLAHESGLEAA